jgi:hypothetical protein
MVAPLGGQRHRHLVSNEQLNENYRLTLQQADYSEKKRISNMREMAIEAAL